MGTTHGAVRSVGSADCYALDLGFVCFRKRDFRNTFFKGCRYYGSVYGNLELKRRCKVSVWRLCYDGLVIHVGFRLVLMGTNCSTLNITTHILFGQPLEVNGDAVGTVSFASIDRPSRCPVSERRRGQLDCASRLRSQGPVKYLNVIGGVLLFPRWGMPGTFVPGTAFARALLAFVYHLGIDDIVITSRWFLRCIGWRTGCGGFLILLVETLCKCEACCLQVTECGVVAIKGLAA